MLKKIDWYIIKQLLATFFLAIALIILIVIVFDISEKLDLEEADRRLGQTVVSSQSAPTILKLADLDTMTVKAEISEADVIRVQPGQATRFTILGDPDTQYQGVMRAIEPAPESESSESSSSTTSSTSSCRALA